MDKTLLSSLTFTLVLTNAHLTLQHGCTVITNDVALVTIVFFSKRAWQSWGTIKSMRLYPNTTFHLLTTNRKKTPCFAGCSSPKSHPLFPTVTSLLSFCGSSIRVQNSHPSPFLFLLHPVHSPVMEQLLNAYLSNIVIITYE